jgi:hypothetical protein
LIPVDQGFVHEEDIMHPAMLQRSAADHIRELIIKAATRPCGGRNSRTFVPPPRLEDSTGYLHFRVTPRRRGLSYRPGMTCCSRCLIARRAAARET